MQGASILPKRLVSEDIIIHELEAKYKVLDKVVDVVKDHRDPKRIFNITTEQLGEFIIKVLVAFLS
jgi:hypothetical protein